MGTDLFLGVFRNSLLEAPTTVSGILKHQGQIRSALSSILLSSHQGAGSVVSTSGLFYTNDPFVLTRERDVLVRRWCVHLLSEIAEEREPLAPVVTLVEEMRFRMSKTRAYPLQLQQHPVGSGKWEIAAPTPRPEGDWLHQEARFKTASVLYETARLLLEPTTHDDVRGATFAQFQAGVEAQKGLNLGVRVLRALFETHKWTQARVDKGDILPPLLGKVGKLAEATIKEKNEFYNVLRNKNALREMNDCIQKRIK